MMISCESNCLWFSHFYKQVDIWFIWSLTKVVTSQVVILVTFSQVKDFI